MAFVVEDGTGLATANAYISVVEGRNYWLDVGITFPNPDSIATAAFPVTMQAAIVAASRYMETRFKNRFKGYREFPATEDPVFAGQGLSWPRIEVYDREGYVLTGVPKGIKNACAEYMRRALAAELAPDPEGQSNVIREKIAVLETEFLPAAIPKFKPYPTADALIAEFIYSGSSCYR